MHSISEKAYDYATKRPEPDYVAPWRTQRRTRTLTVAYFVSLVLAFAFELAGIWNAILMIPFCIFFAITMGIWILLRQTIKAKDLAPRDQLDDYEAAVLATWRRRANSILLIIVIVMAFVLIVLSGTVADGISSSSICTATGLLLLYAFLVTATLPAVGFALTFNRPLDED